MSAWQQGLSQHGCSHIPAEQSCTSAASRGWHRAQGTPSDTEGPPQHQLPWPCQELQPTSPAEWIFLGCWDPIPQDQIPDRTGIIDYQSIIPSVSSHGNVRQIPPELPCSPAGSLPEFRNSGLGTPSLPIKPAPWLWGGSKDGAALLNIRTKFQGADKKHFMILIELGLSGQKR